MTDPKPVTAATAYMVNSIAQFEAWARDNGYTHDGTTWIKDGKPVNLAEELLRTAMEEIDESPSYDDVIAWAKANGYDPYLPNGEYNPKVISWGITALSQEPT